MGATSHKPNTSDGAYNKRAYASAYLSLMNEDAPPRRHALPEIFNTGARYRPDLSEVALRALLAGGFSREVIVGQPPW